MNRETDFEDGARAPQRRRKGRTDVVTLALALLALLVALHTRFYPRAIAAGEPASGELSVRFDEIERDIVELRAQLGAADAQGRTIADRLLIGENQALLLDETLGKFVAHVRALEERINTSAR